ncbi:MAG: hypothetical protein CBD16_02920 [Betaproteobacteria bacterium TMED156]|nr:MAG: hypothetical protein CBD16_02920 [Betaproteobacteria bacterium TMED156]
MKNILLDESKIPLSIYLHLPWCKKKCPFCDFNSHEIKNHFPEKEYCETLIGDFFRYLPLIKDRKVKTIFIGGGTPNLFSADSIKLLVSKIRNSIELDANAEITMEANPDINENEEYKVLQQLNLLKDAGVNRFSIGIQSFNNKQLKNLGRTYNGDQAHLFLSTADKVFSNINVDLMYGTPEQLKSNAIDDVNLTCSFEINHISMYQLAIEPNTLFYKNTPTLPEEDSIWNIYESNSEILKNKGFRKYEISAFSTSKKECKHNLNYWKFGDYLGFGAGAHSKLTFEKRVKRHNFNKNPYKYINSSDLSRIRTINKIEQKDLIFEFMLNGLRLVDGVNLLDFEIRTGLTRKLIFSPIETAMKRGLLDSEGLIVKPTAKGLNFLNDLQMLFLEN